MSEPIRLTDALRAEYVRLSATAVVRPERRAAVADLAARLADPGRWPRYVAVGDAVGVPAHLPALVHAMECGLDFSRHLHNGDPLTARTVHVPAGRPVAGQPPFSWEESATDALRLRRLDRWEDWSLAGLAFVLEGYNGWGYRRYHPEVPSPYLWSMTTVYTAGKYVADGTWSATAVSRQPGAMALLSALAEAGRPFPGLAGVVAADSAPLSTAPAPDGPVLGPGARGRDVAAVQARLLELGYGEAGAADGVFGPRTARAVRRFQAGARDAAGGPLAVDGRVGPATWAALFGPASGSAQADIPLEPQQAQIR